MGYIEQNLITGEKIIYSTKLHWIVFLWPVIFLFLAFIGFVVSAGAGGFFLFIGVLIGLFSFASYATSEFAVTNKRVLIKVGFIRRHSLEILLTKVEGIGVDQDIPGRLLGYGTIVVTGTGGTKETFPNIMAPLEFRRRVQEQITLV
ncbi:MAG: PH domain-containing protein [Chloroflexota bacterium]|mgnify:CR=1 FL=1